MLIMGKGLSSNVPACDEVVAWEERKKIQKVGDGGKGGRGLYITSHNSSALYGRSQLSKLHF